MSAAKSTSVLVFRKANIHNHTSSIFLFSLMSGLSAMDTKASGRLGVLTITYYLWTTFIAVIVGIVLVIIVHPGTGSEKDSHHSHSGPVMTSADALLDLIRLTFTQTQKSSVFHLFTLLIIVIHAIYYY